MAVNLNMNATGQIAMRHLSGAQLAFAGMLTLAVAMGIGRFAFTPILPMMQKDIGLSLSQAGWLASANYVGYFLGALSAIWMRVHPATLVRFALGAIVLLTAGMGVIHDPFVWLTLRGLAGIASAWALIFASAWVLPLLATQGKERLSGVVFGGVGLGTVLAGGCCLIFLRLSWSADQAWVALGTVALLLTMASWSTYGTTVDIKVCGSDARQTSSGAPFGFRGYVLVVCYGLFGFGYIIPATFLPVMARDAIADPVLFGWAWPIFGSAALVSTLTAGWLSAHLPHRFIWAVGHVLMSIGVAIPVVWPSSTAGIVFSSLCVGGTFMVITLAAIQEARRVAPGNSASLIATMTAVFAIGQILGPILVSFVANGQRGLGVSLIAASTLLGLSALVLLSGVGRRQWVRGRRCSVKQ